MLSARSATICFIVLVKDFGPKLKAKVKREENRQIMKRVIVTTTINEPTEAIERFDAAADWTLVVIGDKRTPAGYRLKRGTYVSPEEQEKYDKSLSDAIGWNCIQRRNLGLLWAYEMGADIIALVDDDNIPNKEWGKSLLLGEKHMTRHFSASLPAFDPVGGTNHNELW